MFLAQNTEKKFRLQCIIFFQNIYGYTLLGVLSSMSTIWMQQVFAVCYTRQSFRSAHLISAPQFQRQTVNPFSAKVSLRGLLVSAVQRVGALRSEAAPGVRAAQQRWAVCPALALAQESLAPFLCPPSSSHY